MKKIITLTTDGNSREDGNVFYSRSILVSVPNSESGLCFDERFFGRLDRGMYGEFHGDFDGAIDQIRRFGYQVDELDQIIVLTEES